MAQKKFSCQIKQAAGNRQLKFIASTSSPDRDNDEIMVSGWQLDNYMKNPVVLLNHKYDTLPIARTVDIRKDVLNDRLEVTMEFPQEGVYETADTVYNLAKAGFINAVSVGFSGIEFKHKPEGGRIYIKQELLEISVVGVPAQPQALQMAMAKGLITARQAKLFQQDNDIEIDLDAIQWPDSHDTKNLIIDSKGIRQISDEDETWNVEGVEIKKSDIDNMINEAIDKELYMEGELELDEIKYLTLEQRIEYKNEKQWSKEFNQIMRK